MINHAVSKLEYLQNESADLTEKLKRSLLLEDFCGAAFMYGSCRTQVVGNVRYNLEGAKFIITLGNGEKMDFPLEIVPYKLWPRKALEDYASKGRFIARKLKDAGVEL